MLSFLGNLTNGIPVVGHVKGLVHYAVGDKEGGNRAMYESTRSTAVIGGGIAGCVAGPGGAVAGAMFAGAYTDCVTSGITDTPQGIVGGINEIVNDSKNQGVPLKAMIKTGIMLGADAFVGAGVAGVAKSLSKPAVDLMAAKPFLESGSKTVINNVGKSGVKNVGKAIIFESSGQEILKTVGIGAEKAVAYEMRNRAMESIVKSAATYELENGVMAIIGGSAARLAANGAGKSYSENNRHHKAPESQFVPTKVRGDTTINISSSETGGANGGIGGGPPKDPRNNGKAHKKCDETESALDKFLKLFNAKSLKDVQIRGKFIFKSLNDGQRNYFTGLLQDLLDGQPNGYLERVVEIVKHILSKLRLEDVNHLNLQSLLNFVAQHVQDSIGAALLDLPWNSYARTEDRRQQAFDSYPGNRTISEMADSIWKDLVSLQEKVVEGNGSIKPRFRDIFSAVYHYYKHRGLPNGKELSVEDYFKLIKEVFASFDPTKYNFEFKIILERYIPRYRRRIRLVITKFQSKSAPTLSTFFLTDDKREGKDKITIVPKKNDHS